jgi:ankyrin repeat protein
MDIELNNKFLNAALNNNAAAVKTFLNTPGVLPNYTDKSGDTALMWAARRGHTIMVKTLLAAPGILINQTSSDGTTALMWAAKNGKASVVEALLNAPGILANQQDQKGNNAFDMARENRHFDATSLLLKYKTSIPASFSDSKKEANLAEPVSTALHTLVKPNPVNFSYKKNQLRKIYQKPYKT